MHLALLTSWVVLAQEDFGPGNGGDAGPEEIAAMIGVLAFYGVLIAMIIGIWAFVLYTYYTALDSVPPQFRTMEPWQVFLLLIPCFNIVWLFFVVQKIPESFRNYFWASGDQSRGDCGASIGMWYAIMWVCASIPYLGCLFFIPALVLMIIFIVKMFELRAVARAGTLNLQFPGYGGQMGYYGGDPQNPYASPGDYPPKY